MSGDWRKKREEEIEFIKTTYDNIINNTDPHYLFESAEQGLWHCVEAMDAWFIEDADGGDDEHHKDCMTRAYRWWRVYQELCLHHFKKKGFPFDYFIDGKHYNAEYWPGHDLEPHHAAYRPEYIARFANLNEEKD